MSDEKDARPIWNVEVQINMSIPVHANTADEAGAIAMGDPFDRHLADGNYTADVLTVQREEGS